VRARRGALAGACRLGHARRVLSADAAPIQVLAALGAVAARRGSVLHGGDAGLGGQPPSGPRRGVEGSCLPGDRDLSDVASVETWSGKDRADENFPVGSWLIHRELRPHVHAFYGFARNADDIADSPTLSPEDKVARLDVMEEVLLGRSDAG